jgi:hypothetical protein
LRVFLPMARKVDDGWSDSDDDVLSEMETSVLLGVPDGAVDGPDIKDAAVSRIGGHPVRYILYCLMAYSLTCLIISRHFSHPKSLLFLLQVAKVV